MTSQNDLPPYRPCDLCGGVDQDPRHSFAGVIDGLHPVNEDAAIKVSDNAGELLKDGKLAGADVVRIVSALLDTSSTDRHLDCCAGAGCPLKGTDQDEAACDHRVAAADGKTGEGMRKAALSLRKDS
jgi:hypothetical protein